MRVSALKGDDVGQRLFDALEPHFGAHFVTGGGVTYPSLDMKLGISLEHLEKYKDELKAFMTVDPRGGHFRQEDMYEAVYRLASSKELKPLFDSFTLTDTTWGGDPAEAAKYVAYIYRVMLSHVREKCRNFKALAADAEHTTHPDWLQDVYEAITVTEAEENEPPLQQKPHPLPAFRLEEQVADTIDPNEIVLRKWDFVELQAIVIMADGTRIPADIYTAGPMGLAIAKWNSNGLNTFLELDVANKYIHDSGKSIERPEPPAPAPRAMKKAAAQKRTSGAEAKAKGKAKAKVSLKRPAAAGAPEAADDVVPKKPAAAQPSPDEED